MPITITHEQYIDTSQKEVVQNFIDRVANMKIASALELLVDSVQLELVGRHVYKGKEAMRSVIEKDGGAAIQRTEIFTMLNDHDRVSASGVWHFEDGGHVAFHNVYIFTPGASKIAKIQTYSIIL